MRTQSLDTSPEIEQVQIVGLRAFAPAKKFASVRSISASMHFSVFQSQEEGLSDYERALSFLEHCSPSHVVDAFRTAVPPSREWILHPFDLLPPLARVSSALAQAHVRYALAGSIARALYGFPRGVRTLELLVDLDVQQVTALMQGLRREQFVLASDWSGEGGKPQPLCLLYLPGLVCLALFFPSQPPFDAAVLSRTHPLALDQQLPRVPVLAPQESVLQGAVHYQVTGACDDELYNDLLGVLKIQAPTLDQGTLVTSAEALGVQEVLAHLLADAGIAGAHHVFAAEYS